MDDHLDLSLLDNVNIVSSELKNQIQILKNNFEFFYQNCDEDDGDNNGLKLKLKDLLLLIKCLDLTTLSNNDSFTNVEQLCYRSLNPLNQKILKKLKATSMTTTTPTMITTGAVCVYPQRVKDCQNFFKKFQNDNGGDISIPIIASVVSGFPHGQSSLEATLNDIELAGKSGAKEIDIVLERSLILQQNWLKLFKNLKIISENCKKYQLHLKVILSCGELEDLQQIYKISMVSMLAGCDFIKTSTGKETINAKLVYGLVMCHAILDYYFLTGRKIGLKPAGGIKTTRDALLWLWLIRLNLGPEWLTPKLFRIGASSLLDSVEQDIQRLILSRYPF